MWLAPMVPLLALLAVAPQAAAGPGAAATTAPLEYTRLSLFAIPFSIDRPDRVTREPVEVLLYVSGDRGAHWDFYGKAEPARQRFLFRAGVDGEYWFHVRTRDRSGQVWPTGPATVGLRVIVDTTAPKLQLSAGRGPAGQVIASFRIEEPFPRFETFSIQYRTGPSAAWQKVLIGRQDIHSVGTIHTGEVTWWPPATAGPIEVRAEMTDLAGNPAVTHTQVVAGAVRTAAFPERPAPEAARSSPPTGAAVAAPRQAGPPPGPPVANVSRPPDPWRPASPDASPTRWPAEAAPPGSRTEVAMSAVDGRKIDPPTSSVAIRANPPIGSQYAVTAGQVRMVNSRVFELEYDPELAGHGGTGRVELWGTRDSGQTWRNYGFHEGRQTPFAVTVDEEGTYGFRVVVPGSGPGGKPPQAGDPPDIWVGVDVTKPTGRVLSAQQGSGADADKVTISWEAADNQKLAARPIAVAFSQSPGGPWTPIASNLENVGRYTWILDQRLPERIYLRLEVRDAAGNVGLFDAPQPISLVRSAPGGSIRDIRPIRSGQ